MSNTRRASRARDRSPLKRPAAGPIRPWRRRVRSGPARCCRCVHSLRRCAGCPSAIAAQRWNAMASPARARPMGSQATRTARMMARRSIECPFHILVFECNVLSNPLVREGHDRTRIKPRRLTRRSFVALAPALAMLPRCRPCQGPRAAVPRSVTTVSTMSPGS